MKTSVKMVFCALAITAMLLSCNLSNSENLSISEDDSSLGALQTGSPNSGGGGVSTNDMVGQDCIEDCDSQGLPYYEVSEMPVMDSRVAAYKRIDSTNALHSDLSGSVYNFITSKDSLNLFFPNINAEQAGKCFALTISTTHNGYYILSHSLNYKPRLSLYWIWPDNYHEKCATVFEPYEKCEDPENPTEGCHLYDDRRGPQEEYHVMLICDETGELKRNTLNPDYMNPDLEWVYLYETQTYEDPDWDCNKGDVVSRNVFF